MGAAVVSLLSLSLAAWSFQRHGATEPMPVVPLTLDVPNADPDLARFAVSGDGSRFAFATDEGVAVRDAGQREYRLLGGTKGGESPSFSPDGEWIVFSLQGLLRKVPVAGGAPLGVIARDSLSSGRVNWGEDGRIVFETGGGFALLSPDGSLRVEKDIRNVEQPRLTPDGRGVLYVDNSSGARLMYFDLDADTAFTIIEGSAEAFLLPTGHLLYAPTTGGLFAVRFNASRHEVSGTPIPVLLDFQPNGGVAPFVVTRSGTLVYRTGVDAEQRILIRDPQGRIDTLPLAPRVLSYARFSPDGNQLAMAIGAARGSNRHVAIYDFRTGSMNRFTTEGGGHAPVWSPDGTMLAYTAEGADTDAEDVFVQPVDQKTPPVRMPRVPNDQHASDWPVDTMLVYSDNTAARTLGGRVAGGNTSIVNPVTASTPRPYLTARYGEFGAAISPDRRWAAFTSYETGEAEINVRPFPVATVGVQQRISSGSGQQARWSGDGRTIYYLATANNRVGLRATHVTPGANLVIGKSEDVITDRSLGVAWDVDRATGRIVVTESVSSASVRIVVMQGWLAAFARAQAGAGK